MPRFRPHHRDRSQSRDPDRSLSIAQGAVRVFRGEEMGESQKDLLRACAREEIDVHLPFEELPKADQDFVINGEKRSGEYTDDDYENDRWYGVRGFFQWLESKTYKMHVRVLLSRYRAYTTCPSCHGGRFQPETLNYRARQNPATAACSTLCRSSTRSRFPQRAMFSRTSIFRLTTRRRRCCGAKFARGSVISAKSVSVISRSIARRAHLSGGEVQRVNLTTCLGASLVNTLFVMDEPSVGLHPRDVGRLVRVMHNLRDKGNTLLVVEHEEAIIRASDNLIDIGPGRGERGGELEALVSGSWARPSAQASRCANFTKAFATRSAGGTPPTRIQSLTRDYLVRPKIDSDPEVAAEIFARDQDRRRARTQSQEHRCRNSARHFHLRDRRFRLREIDAYS